MWLFNFTFYSRLESCIFFMESHLTSVFNFLFSLSLVLIIFLTYFSYPRQNLLLPMFWTGSYFWIPEWTELLRCVQISSSDIESLSSKMSALDELYTSWFKYIILLVLLSPDLTDFTFWPLITNNNINCQLIKPGKRKNVK